MPYEGVVATSPSSQRYVANGARPVRPSFGNDATIRTERSLRAGQQTTSDFDHQSVMSWWSASATGWQSKEEIRSRDGSRGRPQRTPPAVQLRLVRRIGC